MTAETQRVFLTGAFGGVGEWLVQELLGLGYAVTCFDLASPATRRKRQRLARHHRFDTIWGDLTDAALLARHVAAARPDIVVHAAAIIPPLTIKRPDLAYAVNVEGTRALVKAAETAGSVTRIVLVSSYSVHGPCNPAKDPPHWTADTPLAPADDYGRQKVEAERIVRASALEYVVVRLCAVFPLDGGASDADLLRFSFLLPYDRREQAIDVRDAAFAIARAAQVPEARGRTFDVGGGEDWQGLGGELGAALMRSAGLPAFPRNAYRQPDASVDDSWYFENWVDSSESQAVLQYQRHGFSAFLAERSRRMGLVRHILPLFGKAIVRRLLVQSPYHGKPPSSDATPFAVAARKVFEVR